jgi:cardiolipin synthase C
MLIGGLSLMVIAGTWIERREGESVRHDTEPGTSFWQRLEIWLMSMLPIEWLL